MNFTALNTKVEAQRFNLHAVQTIIPFPSFDPNNENEHPVAIGINSFEWRGNNAHAIVEEYRSKQTSTITNEHTGDEQLHQYFLFLISGELRICHM
jgi:acyl transferase domain-containing protein